MRCPVLIGRVRELELLRSALESACSGDGVVLLVGEAGVGKSRLLAELLAGPAADALVVRVGCLEADQAEPYALIVQLADALGGLALPFEHAPEAERQTRRVERAVRAGLQCMAGDRVLILAAEDLHWCDQPSLSVLLALAQRPGRCLLALSCRPGPLTPALAGFLAELGRLRPGSQIVLGALDRAEVVRMIRAILALDESVPGDLLDEIMAATEGVPFLVEEVVRSLVESGGLELSASGWRRRPGVPLQVPGSLRQVIEARLLRPPPEVVQVATLTAAIGHLSDLGLIRSLAGLDEATLLRSLRALTDAQILVTGPDGGLAFRHALTREAVLGRLLGLERQALHRTVAEALEREPTTPAPVLAFHWSRAGDVGRAAPHALQAARQAATLNAHREAIGQYEIALAGQAASETEILVEIGDHHAALSECEAAVLHYRRARSRLAVDGDTAGAAALSLRIGSAFADQKRRAEAQRHAEAALAGLPPGHPERWRAGLLLALQLSAQGEYGQAEAALRGTRDDAAGVGLLARLRVEYELGGVRAVQGDWTALERAATTVLDEAPDTSDDALALRHDAHAALGEMAFYRGQLERSSEQHRACLAIAERRGLLTDQVLARWSVAMRLYYLGRWSEMREALAEVQALGFAWMAELAPHFELWLDGCWEEAEAGWSRSWARLAREPDLEFQVGVVRYTTEVLLLLDRPAEALDLVDDLLARARAVGAASHELRLVSCEAAALARLGDPRAGAACEAGLSLARRAGARGCEGLLLRARALAHRAAGRWLEAFADCEASAALLEALGMAFEAALGHRESGLLRKARGRKGDRERAEASLRTARAHFLEVGAQRLVAEVDGLLDALTVNNRPSPRGASLSGREREVAELVAAGLSNRQIARRLVISEKTAAHHVGSILNKLGFGTRAEIAAYVARLPVAPDSPAINR